MLKWEKQMDIKFLVGQGHSIRQVAKLSGHARNTVRSVIRPDNNEPQSVLNNLWKRVVLETAVWQPVFKYDGELVHRSTPVGNRHCPPFADISQG